MAAILRDRINDLLTANADLEKEVVRLRYVEAGQYSNIILDLTKTYKTDLTTHIFLARGAAESAETLEKLKKTRDSLNTMANENDQLKIEVFIHVL